ncbi:uncharacterized protein LOC18767256 isoform X2 [Prunus persica]|nr:uncharacterized protein LOC18767256 isoform X2 [Prunus persica]
MLWQPFLVWQSTWVICVKITIFRPEFVLFSTNPQVLCSYQAIFYFLKSDSFALSVTLLFFLLILLLASMAALIVLPARTATQQGPGSLSRFATFTLSRALGTATSANETRTQKLERIADELLDLTKIERHDYSILFRLKMGLNRYGPAVSGIGSASSESGPASADSKVVEKTAFDIKIEKFDAAAKIKIIKEVRTFTDLGLKEAKELVEKAPVVVKKGVTKEEAGPIVDKLKELGATVVLE